MYNLDGLVAAIRIGNVSYVTECIKVVNINAHASNGQIPLHLAVRYQTEQSKQILNLLLHSGADVNLTDNKGLTALIIAIRSHNVDAVTLLLKQASLIIDYEFSGGRTALHYAAHYGNKNSCIIIDELLIANANPNKRNSLSRTPLDDAFFKRNIHTIKKLASTNNLYHRAIKTFFIETRINSDDMNGILQEYINLSQNLPFNQETYWELYNLSMFCMIEGVFNVAYYLLVCVLEMAKNAPMALHPQVVLDYDKLQFPKNSPKVKLIKIFKQIKKLLSDSPRCIELLKELDEDIRKNQHCINADFCQINPENPLKIEGFPFSFPTEPTQPQKFIKSYGLLRFLIRKKLQNHDIEKQDELITFIGFVDVEKANKIVEDGALFKEQFLTFLSIFHGLYSHYLHWYLLAIALEKKELNLYGLTLRELLGYMVNIFDDKGISMWQFLIDLYDPKKLNFSYPESLNSILLCNDSLPYLRGYLINSWFKNIEKLQKVMKEKHHGQFLNYETILFSQLAFSPNFLDVISTEEIKNYYKKSAKTGDCVVTTDNNILIKSAELRFKFFHTVRSERNEVVSSINHSV
jgi:hypothetical protein